MGFGAFKGLAKRFTKSGRNVGKKERSLQGRTRQHQIKSLEEDIRMMPKVQERERAGLKQGAFARGLGKSTIFQQNDDFMRERHEIATAQKHREYDLALRGKSLDNAINKFNKRTGWTDTLDSIASFGMSAMGAAGAVGGFWGSGDPTAGLGADAFSVPGG